MNAPYQQAPQHPQPDVGYRATGPAPTFAPLGAGTRIAFIAIVAVMMVGFLGAVGFWTAAVIGAESNDNHQPNDALMGIGFAGFFVVIMLLYVQIAVGLVWVYKAWSWLPWDQRYTRHWKGWITPSQAAFFLLIPYFHYYWMFVCNTGLCDALDRLRVSYPTSEPAPKTLAIVACVCQLIVPFPVGAIVWIIFMSKVEKMTKEMSAAMQPRHQNAF